MSESRALATAVLAAMFIAVTATGCASLQGSDGGATATTPPPPDVRPASFDDQSEEERKALGLSDFSLENIGTTTKKLVGRGPNKQVAQQLFATAEAKYRQATAAEGATREQLFAEAAPLYAEAAERWPDSALAMDALFMSGESHFFADKYPNANLAYEKLIKAFPNNRYMDTVDQRRFAIAKYWLDLNRENPEQFYHVNLTDKKRPWKDVRGHGLRVFEKIRVDDPAGRLSDDATLTAANENFAARKFTKADEYYTDLRTSFPTSEHQFLAHFLGLKAKLNCYAGPAYSGAPLEEAEKLIKQMRRQFPQESEREREFIDKAAAEIRLKKAQRLMFTASYYDNRAEYRAAKHYLERVVREYEDTPLAAQAQERIGQIAGKPPVPPQRLAWLVNLFPESDDVKPLLEASQQPEAAEATQVATEPAQPTDTQATPSFR